MTSLQSKGSESDVQCTEELVEVRKEGWEGEFGAVWKKEKEKECLAWTSGKYITLAGL